ncbi:hypothetical protein NGC36_17645 [Serratia rubidaea]|nr:hypothetical protein [Serratia rubidaea]
MANASVIIRILTGDYHYSNLINMAFCVAVSRHRSRQKVHRGIMQGNAG